MSRRIYIQRAIRFQTILFTRSRSHGNSRDGEPFSLTVATCYAVLIVEITPQQASILDRLRARDFKIVAFPMYESYIGVRKENCAALLAPQASGGFAIYGHPAFLVGGNLSAKVFKGNGNYFVSKQEKVEATPERNSELDRFSAELAEALLPTA